MCSRDQCRPLCITTVGAIYAVTREKAKIFETFFSLILMPLHRAGDQKNAHPATRENAKTRCDLAHILQQTQMRALLILGSRQRLRRCCSLRSLGPLSGPSRPLFRPPGRLRPAAGPPAGAPEGLHGAFWAPAGPLFALRAARKPGWPGPSGYKRAPARGSASVGF